MRRVGPYARVLSAGLLIVILLVLLGHRMGTSAGKWSKSITTRSSDGKLTSYRMMVYSDRSIVVPDGTCTMYLKIRNIGKHSLRLTSTYITNRRYANGRLCSEEIGDWRIPGAPLKLMPGETRDVPCAVDTHPARLTSIGIYRYQFCGFGLQTNTVSVLVLPIWLIGLVLAAIAALAWRARSSRCDWRACP